MFVNPTYVLDTDTDTPAARASRRTGYVLAAARAMEDRPLIIRLRAPERRLARAIERRINERFQDVADDDLQSHGNTAGKKVANAQDEALLYVYVPKAYADHWEHFAGLVRHLYVNGDNPAFAALKARQLAEAADHDPKSGAARDQLRLGGPGQAGPARPGPAADRPPAGRPLRRRPGGGVHRRPRGRAGPAGHRRHAPATRSASTPSRPWASCPPPPHRRPVPRPARQRPGHRPHRRLPAAVPPRRPVDLHPLGEGRRQARSSPWTSSAAPAGRGQAPGVRHPAGRPPRRHLRRPTRPSTCP